MYFDETSNLLNHFILSLLFDELSEHFKFTITIFLKIGRIGQQLPMP